MIDITNVSSDTTVKVRLNFTGTPELPVSYSSRDIQPDWLCITYAFGPGQHRGWWVATDVKVAGQRVLKPGPDGQQRLGKERHTAHWYGGRTRDVQTDRDLPEWLDSLVSELRPSGQVTLPGGA